MMSPKGPLDLRAKWIRQMGNPQIHSVWGQLWKMIYSDLNLRTIGLITDLEPTCPLNNPMVRRLAIEGYAPLQALGIRRLWSDRRDDISLKRILHEMKRKVSVFTGENYLSWSGLPYSTPSFTDEELSKVSVRPLPGSAFVSPDSPIMVKIRTSQAHEQFDRLSKTSPENRKPSDRIPERLFEALENHVPKSGINKVVIWSSQYVAHAGDPDDPYWKDVDPTWGDIESSQRALAQVAQIISGQVLNGPASAQLVPTAQYDRFEYLENIIS
ncbi:hypothetical protein ABH19_11735 [Leptospirillum sp. Group II 'CF-1']|jgi:hypothetical protein|nr:hypothetical protein [Leptospirillum sp. Group II 'CF-1']AKS24272.1 hypothetical protein ABH19_11735 [Leptospirillum sp. Group II 'CF-1']